MDMYKENDPLTGKRNCTGNPSVSIVPCSNQNAIEGFSVVLVLVSAGDVAHF